MDDGEIGCWWRSATYTMYIYRTPCSRERDEGTVCGLLLLLLLLGNIVLLLLYDVC
jgi:hypothetical protein